MTILPLSSWLPFSTPPLLIAGPCSAESREQVLQTAQALKKETSVSIFRAGIWKPRTQLGSFEGVGEEGLAWLREVKEQTGLLVTTEVATAKHVELCLKHGIDILWLGARTTPNPFAVQEIAEALRGVDIPIMVKNPISPDLMIWRGALERLSKVGIRKLIAVHRGFSAPESRELRNLPQWKIPIQLKNDFPNLPMICDPSHICGKREHLWHISQMALDINFDGLMIEVHPHPDQALSDSRQQITVEVYKKMMEGLLLKREDTLPPAAKKVLVKFRYEIDAIDESLVELLSKRMKISEQISALKAEHNISLFQLGRFQELMRERAKRGKELGLTEDFVAEIFNTIHEQSILRQSETSPEKKD